MYLCQNQCKISFPDTGKAHVRVQAIKNFSWLTKTILKSPNLISLEQKIFLYPCQKKLSFLPKLKIFFYLCQNTMVLKEIFWLDQKILGKSKTFWGLSISYFGKYNRTFWHQPQWTVIFGAGAKIFWKKITVQGTTSIIYRNPVRNPRPQIRN